MLPPGIEHVERKGKGDSKLFSSEVAERKQNIKSQLTIYDFKALDGVLTSFLGKARKNSVLLSWNVGRV